MLTGSACVVTLSYQQPLLRRYVRGIEHTLTNYKSLKDQQEQKHLKFFSARSSKMNPVNRSRVAGLGSKY
jgi:hypothetical protein